MLIGVAAGLMLALMNLIPGAHPTGLMLLLFPLLGADSALVAGGVSVGAGTVLSILHSTYHPVAKSMLAHADIAAKMAYDQRGASAIWVHRLACEQAMNLILLLGGFFVVAAFAGADWLPMVAKALGWISPVVLVAIVFTIAARAQRCWSTLLVMVLALLLGFIALHAPATKGQEWTLTALLGGLFTLPAGWSLWQAKKPQPVPASMLADEDIDDPDGSEMTGALVGVLTGFLAGVGTGSLVALLRRDEMPDTAYIGLASGAEMANGAWALVMMALLGSGRSGVAVAVGEAGVTVDPWGGLVLLAALLLGRMLGDRVIERLEEPYRKIINFVPQRRMGQVLFGLAMLSLLWSGGLTAVVLALASWMLSSLAKSWKTPNQALLVCLIGPVLVAQLGMLTDLAGVLGL